MTYPELVNALSKPGLALQLEATPNKLEMSHMALGLSSDVGEVTDVIKKYVYYNQPLDIEHLMEELGDVEFFLERIRQLAGLTREKILAANVAKLTQRYGSAYSDRAAKERKDKNQ